MGQVESYNFGIECRDLSNLVGRVLVSGVQLLDPDTADKNGYGERPVIVPTEPRQPTSEELRKIVATAETPHVAKFVKVAVEIGNKAVSIAEEPGYKFDPASEPVYFGGGIRGISGGYREDPPNALNVSVDGDRLLVGDHIDTHPYPNLRSTIINMGPGERWHRITPGFDITPFGDELPRPPKRNDHMKHLVATNQADQLLSFWFKLNPPSLDPTTGEMSTEAIAQSPVTRYLHDGSTYGVQDGSLATFIASPPNENPWEAYRSIV